MLLVIDVGNTNTIFGIYEQKKLLFHWRVKSDQQATEDEYAMVLNSLMDYKGIAFKQIAGMIISSVVPPLTFTLRKLAEKYLGIEPIILGPGVKTGLNIKYDSPKEVGADRIANAVAAIHLYSSPVIIVDFGTAITFCLVDESGNYQGGAIVPGVKISVEALYQQAAKLTHIEIVKPESVIGRNTVSAMQSGIFYGYVGMVDGIVGHMKLLLNKQPKVIATGGMAELICSGTHQIDVVHPFLTLEGLRLIYEKNRGHSLENK
ncbi:type III pantothenate kinase [Thermoflavimicrobium daqui]|jgi:type III pantothenate kinase|uniref:Type III pantothenate kinase n=1 Tax=Thermoflavimicrobium daqui TaxID=2137476 RepID=A0A364K2X7_9BACL|nr:type III pantothenate kinase [Thermoflavimicrobium daqui]RAL23190.1 type III pantothenate kinase [Thermoflavimicrobium daqui]